MKLQSKPKLEKVPPAFWILADTRIMGVLFKRSDFNPDKLPAPK